MWILGVIMTSPANVDEALWFSHGRYRLRETTPEKFAHRNLPDFIYIFYYNKLQYSQLLKVWQSTIRVPIFTPVFDYVKTTFRREILFYDFEKSS